MSKFIPTKNRSTLVSNEILERNRYNLKLNAQKLLVGLAQSIDHTQSLFNEIEVDINGIWAFLGIESRNDRYEIVRDALFNITENPLQEKVSKKKWSSIPWMSVKFDEDVSTYIKIKFSADAKPYLLNLREYTKIQGGYIAKLSSAYATWLYPILKMIQTKYYGTHEISIERLKELTFTENPKEHPAYNTDRSANNKFLARVVGVSVNRQSKKIEIVKDSPLYEINEKTDIAVNVVKMTKIKNKYTGVVFHVVSKTAAAKALPESVDKSRYVSEIPKHADDLNSRIPISHVYSYAKASDISIQEYLDKAGYYMKGDYAYKKHTAEEYQKLIKARDEKEGKRTYRQTTIEDAIGQLKKKIKHD